MSTPKRHDRHDSGVCRLLTAWADETQPPGDFTSIFGSPLRHPLEDGSPSASAHTKNSDAVARSSESNSRFGGFLEQIGCRVDSPEESEDSMLVDFDLELNRPQTYPRLAQTGNSAPMHLLPGASSDYSVKPYQASKRHSQRRFLISSQFTTAPPEFLQRSIEGHAQDDVKYHWATEMQTSVSFTASVRDEANVVHCDTARTSEYSLLFSMGQTTGSDTSVVAAGDNYLEELSLCTPIFESSDPQTGSSALGSSTNTEFVGSVRRCGSETETSTAFRKDEPQFVSEKSGGWRSIGENWNSSRLRKMAVRFRDRLSKFTHRTPVKMRSFTDMQRQLENKLLEKHLGRHQSLFSGERSTH